MLSAALRQQREHAQLASEGVRDLRRFSGRGRHQLVRMLTAYQVRSAVLTIQAAPVILAEQGIASDTDAAVVPESVATGDGVTRLLNQVDSQLAFDRLMQTLILDAGRTAGIIDAITRTKVTRYVRVVNSPCCSRCAILAGRVYRWSTGFQRHPHCHCQMVPSTQSRAGGLTTSPDALFRAGAIRDLTRAETRAINDGADLTQVVNIRRKTAGLNSGGSVIARPGRLTPERIASVASSKPEALDLMRRYGYAA